MFLKVRDRMTKSLHTIGEDQSLAMAKKLMAAHAIRHLPVLAGGRLVGLLSDRDVKLAYAVESGDAGGLLVRDVCVGDVYTVSPDDSLKEAAAQLASREIGSAIVVERNTAVGIFTATDACRVLAELLE